MKSRKFLALFIAIVSVLMIATGCGEKEPPNPKPPIDPSNPYAEHVKLTFMTYVAEGIDQNSKTDAVKNFLQEKFNCEIEIQPFGGGEWDKVNNMLVSGEYPDLFKMKDMSTLVQAYEDEVLVNIDELVDQGNYPALKKYLDRARKATNLAAFGGDFYYIPTDTGVYQHGLWARMDWLENLNLSIPKTYDEFYTVLKTIKERNPGGNLKTALSMPGTFWLGHFYTGFVGSSDYVLKNGKIYNRQTVDEIREAYAYMNKLYEEGLLDEEIFIGPDDQYIAEKFGSGKIAFMMGNCYSDWLPRLIPPILTNSPDAEVDIINLPAGPAGAHQLSGNPYFIMTAISKSSKNPERALAVLDYILSDEGRDLVKNGVEGVHYTKDTDGKIVRKENAYKADKFACEDYRYHWLLELVTTDPYYIAPDYPYAELFTANVKRLEEGTDSGYIITPMPQLNGYTSEVANEYGSKINDIIAQYETKFITGELELNDATWAAYQKELNDNHYQDLVNDWTKAYNDSAN